MHLPTATVVPRPINIPAHFFPAPADIRTYALPAYESSFTAGATLSGVGVSIDNTAGNAGLPHPGNAGLPQPGNGGISIDTTGGNAGLADPGIGRSVASNVLGNLSLPQSGLFHAVLTGGPYLITSDPAFTSRNTFLSSDYYLHNLGYDPQTMVRLGDGLYEQQLVQNQVLELTGKAVLPPYADAQSMVAGLMDAGADLARELNLPLGAGLTAEQIAGLTRDVIIVQTVVVDGQAVLAPVVYLAQGSRQDMNGPLIAAKDINLTNTQTFINSGLIQAENSFVFDGREIDNTFGTLKSGGLMALATLGDVNLTSGRLDAGALSLNAGGNLILDTATSTLTQVSAGASRVTTTLGPQAEIKVAGDALIITGGNFEQHAGNLTVGGNLGMAVGGDWNLGTVQTGEHKVVERPNEYPGLTLNEQMTGFKIGPAKGTADTDLNRAVGSTVRVGGVSGIAVGNNLTAQGAQIDLGGGGTIVAGNTITLGAAKAVSTTHSLGSDSDGSGSYAENIHFMDEKATGTTLNSGDTLNLVAGKDINLIGSSIILEQGTATLAAAGDVNIGAATETHTVDIRERHTSDHGLSTTSEQSSLKGQTTQSIGSLVSADAVTVMSGNDINVVGSVIVGTGDVGLLAGNNVNITTSQDTTNQDSYRQERRSGFMTQGWTVGVGSEQETDAIQSSSVTNNPSMIGSLTGNVAIVANNKVSIEGSQVLAAQDLDIIGKSVDITAATDTWKYNEQQTYHFDGLMVGISSPITDAAQTGLALYSAVNKTDDARTKALGAMAAGMYAYNNAGAIGQSAKDIGSYVSSNDANGSAGSNISINISLGVSNSRSETTSEGSNAVGSTLAAGHDVNVVATDGDIHVKGSDIVAMNDAVLSAINGNILLEAAENSYSQHSDSSGVNASIGVGISIGKGKTGLTLNIGASAMQDKADGEGTTWTNTHITAGNMASLTSGGDTTLKGAVVSGNQVVADVGGNLTIESLQNTDTYDENAEHGGFSVAIPLYYGSYAFSANAGATTINSNYQSVVEQSAIHAGDGGFQVNVAGDTTLTGGAITSTQTAIDNNANQFSTGGTLTLTDIANHADYEGDSWSASGWGSSGGGGGGGNAGAAHESDSADSVTRAAISGIAGNTDARTGDAETGIKPIFNQQQVKDNLDAGVAVTEVLSQQVIKLGPEEAHRVMFLQGAETYAVTTDPETGEVTKRLLTAEEKQNLQSGSDGKIHIYTNGVYNDLDTAAAYAVQMDSSTGNSDTVYLVYFPEASNFFAELLVAGYQKFMENDFWGLSNATTQMSDYMQQYGSDGLTLDGHSRGAMTIGNAMESLSNDPSMAGVMANTNIYLYGSAYNAQDMANLLYGLSGGQQDSVNLQVHADDFVGTIIGGNTGTYDTSDRFMIVEWMNMLGGQVTVHNCYGSPSEACINKYGAPITISIKAN